MNNLTLLRKQKGLSQHQLGKEVGLASNTICQYENGRRIPDVSTLIALADYFNVSLDYLLCRQSPDISQSRQQLLDKIQTLSEEQVQTLLSVAKQFK